LSAINIESVSSTVIYYVPIEEYCELKINNNNNNNNNKIYIFFLKYLIMISWLLTTNTNTTIIIITLIKIFHTNWYIQGKSK